MKGQRLGFTRKTEMVLTTVLQTNIVHTRDGISRLSDQVDRSIQQFLRRRVVPQQTHCYMPMNTGDIL